MLHMLGTRKGLGAAADLGQGRAVWWWVSGLRRGPLGWVQAWGHRWWDSQGDQGWGRLQGSWPLCQSTGSHTGCAGLVPHKGQCRCAVGSGGGQIRGTEDRQPPRCGVLQVQGGAKQHSHGTHQAAWGFGLEWGQTGGRGHWGQGQWAGYLLDSLQDNEIWVRPA